MFIESAKSDATVSDNLVEVLNQLLLGKNRKFIQRRLLQALMKAPVERGARVRIFPQPLQLLGLVAYEPFTRPSLALAHLRAFPEK
jgi:hypothetical protein